MKSGKYSRMSNNTHTVSQQWSWKSAGTGPWYVAEPFLTVFPTSDFQAGSYNPKWRKQRGKVATNSDYDRIITGTTSSSVNLTGYRQAYYFEGGNLAIGRHECAMVGNPTHYGSGEDVSTELVDYASADNRAKLRLFAKITDEYRKFSGGTLMWELGESLRMIRKPSAKLFKSVENYLLDIKSKKKRFKDLRLDKRNEMVRDTYLEATLGWQPLISDIVDVSTGAFEFFRRNQDEFEGIRSITSGQFRTEMAQNGEASLQFPTPNLGSHPMNQSWVRKETVTVQYTAQCLRQVLYPKNELQAIIQLSGFSLREWVPTVWNCIPYSFIADYFTNIGDVVEFYATDRSSIVGLTRSVKRQTDKSYQYRLDFVAPTNEWETNFSTRNLGSVTQSRRAFQRRLIDPITLDVRFEWENPLPKPKKFFNMVALASAVWHANLNPRL